MKYPCRLDKFLTIATGYSRSEVKILIKAKRITINQELVTKANHKILATDSVELDQKQLEAVEHRYYILHKPAGYVSTKAEGDYPSALSLITQDVDPDSLHCAGRLDADTTGLLLITNDGQWSHRVASPNAQKSKCYLVELADPITEEQAQELRDGVWLNNETTATLPATLEILAPTRVELSISEGRYHQVKRMFAAVGNKVTELHRQSIGSINLDDELCEGEYRPLTEAEVAEFI